MSGRIEVITGPMFSWKSGELARRYQKHAFRPSPPVIKAFRHELDRRFSEPDRVSRDGSIIQGIQYLNQFDEDFFSQVEKAEIVLISEAQFFDVDIVPAVRKLREQGKTVIIEGLDMDVNARPFGFMPQLLSMADEVVKCRTTCMQCGKYEGAVITKWVGSSLDMLGNNPVKISDSKTDYLAVCWDCYYNS